MKIFVGGMTRSGSTWTFNVTRAIVRAGGKIPFPEEQEQSEMVHLEQLKTAPLAANEVLCIKTHHGFEGTSDDVKLICNYRDVRAAALSFMRFMRCDFERVLNATEEMMSITDFYFQAFKPENALYIRYDDMVENPLKVIQELNDFLKFDLPDPVLAHIEKKHSKDNVAQLLKTMETVKLDNETATKTRFEPRYYQDGSVRAYDRKTSFQAGHITSSKEDEWREAFTVEQKEQLNQLCHSWLEQYGFTI